MNTPPSHIVNSLSLGLTIDRINAAGFDGRRLAPRDRREAISWIADRAGKPRSYAGLPAPTDNDFAAGVTVFTGERVASRAGTAHVLGEEACRALRTLGASDTILEKSGAGMLARLAESKAAGFYCCGICSVAMWRNILSGAFDRREERLAHGLRRLRSARKGGGRWRRFPFYYTLLALSELELPSAIAEIRHAAPLCERLLRRSSTTVTGSRRIEVMRRVLSKI